MLKYIVSFAVINIHLIGATHFRGGTVSWRVDTGSIVEFHFRLAWELGRGGCDVSKKGSYVTSLAGEKWICSRGCAGHPDVADNSYYCTEVDLSEDWEQGEKRFSYSLVGPGPYKIGYTGRNWMPLDYGTSGQWNLETSIDLRSRSDTTVPNRSPVTSFLPVYTLPFGCTTVIRIPVFDEDGDVIKCRWSRGTECGSICNNVPSIPSGHLDETTCTLTLDISSANNYTDGGNYAVALTIEDFPKSNILLNGISVSTSGSLSSIPLQFLLKTVHLPSVCSDAPTIIDTPSDRTTFVVPDGYSWSSRVYIQAHGGRTPDHITVSGPHSLKSTSLQPDDKGRPDVMFTDLTWSPTTAEKGVNILCVKAADDSGEPSEQRCFILLAGAPDPCDISPCLHGGTCSLQFDSYKCACPSGITGINCETDIDECRLSPCENGGVCTNSMGSFQCFCLHGFTGFNCSETDHCASNPCHGHGQCLQTGNTYTCMCSKGFSGVNCNIDDDDCASSPCLHGALCTDMVDDYFCACPSNYGGKNCDQDIDFCSPSPCRNGGLCQSFQDSYACHCQDGYTGLNCEIPESAVCGNDESHCTCKVNGKPVKVTIPQPYHDDTLERDLKAGIIGYPIGLALGALGCTLYHYLVRRGCKNSGSYRPHKRPGSSSSTAPLSPPETPVTPSHIQPNIYRSGFNDDTIFKTGEKMDHNSYMTGRRDW